MNKQIKARSVRQSVLEHAVHALFKDLERIGALLRMREAEDGKKLLQPELSGRIRNSLNKRLDGWASALVYAATPFCAKLFELAIANRIKTPVIWAEKKLLRGLQPCTNEASISTWLNHLTRDEFDYASIGDSNIEQILNPKLPLWVSGYVQRVSFDEAQSEQTLSEKEASQIVAAMEHRLNTRVKDGIRRVFEIEAVRIASVIGSPKIQTSKANRRKKLKERDLVLLGILNNSPDLDALEICKRIDSTIDKQAAKSGRGAVLLLIPPCKCKCDTWVSAYRKHPKRIATWISKRRRP